MLWLIVKKEIHHNILTLRTSITYGLALGLVALSLFVMIEYYDGRMQEYRVKDSSRRERLLQIEGIADPMSQYFKAHESIYWGVSGIRTPRVLGIFAHGLDDRLPLNISLQEEWKGIERRLEQNLVFRVFSTPDPVYIVNLVLSLLSLLLAYDSISGERERGTLKLLLANPVPRDLVLLGKWFGGYLPLAIPLVVALGAAYLILCWLGVMRLTPDDALSVMGFGAISLLYLSISFTLGLAVSVLCYRTSMAISVSLVLWIIWMLILPNISPVLARLVEPVADRSLVNKKKAAARQEAHNLAGLDRNMPDYHTKIKAEMNRQAHLVESAYRQELGLQRSLASSLARLSPAACYVFSATALAGTGLEFFDAYLVAQARYRSDFWSYREHTLGDKVYERIKSGALQNWYTPAQVPRFTLSQADLLHRLEAATPDLLLLVLYNAALFMLAYSGFLRLDIT